MATRPESARASLPAAQPHRPERRRQDDVLQHADRPAAAPTPAASCSTATTSPTCRCTGASAWACRRSFQILSVFPNLTAFENVRVAVQAQDPRRWGLWRDAYALRRPQRPHLVAAGRRRAGGSRRRSLRQSRPRPAAACWRSPSRWPPTPNCCCWTNRWPASPKPTAQVVGSADPQAGRLPRRAADRARHRPRAGAVRPHHRAAPGPPDRRRQPRRGRRAIPTSSPPISAPNGSSAAPAPTDADRAAHAASKPLLVVEQVRAGYAGSVVLEDLSLIVHEGEAVALLGRNGVGKTTTLRAITGTVRSSRRPHHAGRHRDHQRAALRDQPAGHLAGAGGPPAVPQPDGAGQPAPGDARRAAPRWTTSSRCSRN